MVNIIKKRMKCPECGSGMYLEATQKLKQILMHNNVRTDKHDNIYYSEDDELIAEQWDVENLKSYVVCINYECNYKEEVILMI